MGELNLTPQEVAKYDQSRATYHALAGDILRGADSEFHAKDESREAAFTYMLRVGYGYQNVDSGESDETKLGKLIALLAGMTLLALDLEHERIEYAKEMKRIYEYFADEPETEDE